MSTEPFLLANLKYFSYMNDFWRPLEKICVVLRMVGVPRLIS